MVIRRTLIFIPTGKMQYDEDKIATFNQFKRHPWIRRLLKSVKANREHPHIPSW